MFLLRLLPPAKCHLPLTTHHFYSQHWSLRTGCLTSPSHQCYLLLNQHPNAQTSCLYWHLLLIQHMNYPLGLCHLQLLQHRFFLIIYLLRHFPHFQSWTCVPSTSAPEPELKLSDRYDMSTCLQGTVTHQKEWEDFLYTGMQVQWNCTLHGQKPCGTEAKERAKRKLIHGAIQTWS